MPGGDRTGPKGFGPSTGRGLGYCAGYNTPGYTKVFGMGFGRGLRGGYGRGGGWFRGGRRGIYAPTLIPPSNYAPPITPEAQLSMLKQEKQYLESEVEGVKNAIEDLSKKIEELEKK